MCCDIFGVCKYTCFGIKSERLGSSQLENVHVSIDNPHNYKQLLICIFYSSVWISILVMYLENYVSQWIACCWISSICIQRTISYVIIMRQ